MPYPRLRYVEAIQIEHEGKPMVVLRDPEDLIGNTLIVPMPLFMIMTLLDGRRGASEIQQVLARAAGGQMFPAAELDRIVREMDELYLLENERTAARRLAVEQSFAALLTRPATHAGGAYPAEPEACAQMFEEFFKDLELDGHDARPRGLLAPHIDLRVGGQTLARALATLGARRPPKLYIILGVAHHPAKNLFTLTEKSFETPLGLAETDRAAAARLKELYGAGRLDGEYVHKNEHSVEFPAVALRYLHRAQPGFKILPLLCGSLHECLAPGAASAAAPPPAALGDVRDFIAALRQLIAEWGGDVCIIASVDLSHVGLKFGDEKGIDQARLEHIRARDAEMLERVQALDPEGFLDHFRPDANSRNVDAVTAVYVMLHALGPGRGKLIDYQQWHEQETDSMVSFAGLAIY